MRKIGRPEKGELVVCEIVKINPNSAYARLLEYDKTGMIHVSEVAKRWVRNIREFVKENQLVVCKVRIAYDDHISLSIKRVDRNQADRKLQEFKRERNSEKLLEQTGKMFGKNLDEAYEEIGYTLQEEFGSIFKSFEIALKNPELFSSKGIDKKWADAITETAKKSFVKKTYDVIANLVLVSYASDGIDAIKKSLSGIKKKGIDTKYISASKYKITGKGEDIKTVKGLVEDACQKAVNAIESAGGTGSFTIEEQ